MWIYYLLMRTNNYVHVYEIFNSMLVRPAFHTFVKVGFSFISLDLCLGESINILIDCSAQDREFYCPLSLIIPFAFSLHTEVPNAFLPHPSFLSRICSYLPPPLCCFCWASVPLLPLTLLPFSQSCSASC